MEQTKKKLIACLGSLEIGMYLGNFNISFPLALFRCAPSLSIDRTNRESTTLWYWLLTGWMCWLLGWILLMRWIYYSSRADFFRLSPQQLAIFKAIQDSDNHVFRDPNKSSTILVGLIQDVIKTRWNSAYNVLRGRGRCSLMKVAVRK